MDDHVIVDFPQKMIIINANDGVKVIEGKIKGGIEVTGRRGRRRRKPLDYLKERRG
jgi:hypothetical protein